MDENGFYTGKIPVTGDGIHKTYEESFFDVLNLRSLPELLRYESRGLYYKIDECLLYWLDDIEFGENGIWNKIQSNPKNFIEVKIINIVPINNDWVLLEYIDSSILNNHLLHESQEKQGYQRELK